MKGRTFKIWIFFTRLALLFSFSRVDFFCHPVNKTYTVTTYSPGDLESTGEGQIHVEIHTFKHHQSTSHHSGACNGDISINDQGKALKTSTINGTSFRRMQSTFSINHLIAPVIRCAHVPQAMPGATIIKPLQGLVLYYHRYSFHPDDNHYMNTLTFNYKIHEVIYAFKHSSI